MPRPHFHLKLRIVKPLPPVFEGFSTDRFQVNQVYEINVPLCDLLIASGYAEPLTEDENPKD